MDKIERVLVPVDFSECAGPALRQATVWAQRCGAELHFLHVARVPWYLGATRTSVEELRALKIVARVKADAEMAGLVVFVKRQTGQEPRSKVTHGTPRNVILEAAELSDYDLIVMGTHGRTGLAHLFLGSTTEGVVRRAPCPVLTVRGDPVQAPAPAEAAAAGSAKEGQLKKILVPVDFSRHSRAALEYALGLSKIFDAAVEVQHVVEIQPSYAPVGDPLVSGRVINPVGPFIAFAESRAVEQLTAMLEPFEAQGWKIGRKVVMGYPRDVLLAAARSYDLIVVGTHGRKGLSHFFLGSVAEQIVRRASCPVLTIRGPQEAK